MAPFVGFFGSRFTLERTPAPGSETRVQPARDNDTGERVALKILPAMTEEATARFRREIDALGKVQHEGIVRYVAHGTDAGRLFLATEWVEGVDLGTVLADGPLSMADVLALAARLADALACLHEHHLVHRDLTPAAVLLPGRAAAAAKLADFGVSRTLGDADVTRPGRVVGTPGYIAPERLRGEPTDARADVFSLGCVLYECLTGAPPFLGPTLAATLSKVLLEPPPRIEALRQDTPPALADLIRRMLSKSPAARPADGEALRAELGDLDAELGAIVARHGEMSKVERVLVSLVVVSFGPPATAAALLDLQRAHGGRAEQANEGQLVLAFPVVPDGGSVVGAARCALDAVRIRGVTGASVATVHDEPAGRARAIERAASAARESAGAAIVDDVTESLLPSRFEIAAHRAGEGEHGAGAELFGERDALDIPRSVFGSEPPLQDRVAELERLVTHARERMSARKGGAALILGPTGVGKSRLRQEALRALATQIPSLAVCVARGDPERRSAPLELVAGFVRRFARLGGGSPAEDRARLRARVGRTASPADAARIARHLGEIVGVRSDEVDPSLELARADAALMHDLVRTAFVDLLAAEASTGPLLVVLEDLHYADPPSLALFGAALRALEDKPFVIWALGLPPLRQRLAAWPEGHVQLAIELAPLTQAASFALASSLMSGRPGQPAPDDAKQRELAYVAARSLGVPLFVEELAIGVAAGVDADLSPTLMALLEARLLGVSADARRVARSAALVGTVFWRGAIGAMLPTMRSGSLDAALAELDALGWLVEHGASRFPGERELAFRHDIMREAAEALDTEEDRALGHALAGRWLEANGERDPGCVATHYARAGLSHVAADRFARSAALALAAGDPVSALERVGRGLSCAMDPRVIARLRGLEARASADRAAASHVTTAATPEA